MKLKKLLGDVLEQRLVFQELARQAVHGDRVADGCRAPG